MSTFSIVIPTMGLPQVGLAAESLQRTCSREYEICVGVDVGGKGAPNLSGLGAVLRTKALDPAWVRLADGPGMAHAIQAGVEQATGDWLVVAHDDIVFLPGWDDFLDDLREDRMMRLEALDPHGLTWPPAVLAGDTPDIYKPDVVEKAATLRPKRPFQAGGPFLDVVTVCHRSRWIPWPDWSGRYGTHDTAWWMETSKAHPDLIHGWLPGRCVFHFVSGSVRDRAADDPPGTFEARYGMSVEAASNMIWERSKACS